MLRADLRRVLEVDTSGVAEGEEVEGNAGVGRFGHSRRAATLFKAVQQLHLNREKARRMAQEKVQQKAQEQQQQEGEQPQEQHAEQRPGAGQLADEIHDTADAGKPGLAPAPAESKAMGEAGGAGSHRQLHSVDFGDAAAAAAAVASMYPGKEPVKIAQRPRSLDRVNLVQRRRLAEGGLGLSAEGMSSALEAKLQLLDDTLNEFHRVAQVGFTQVVDTSRSTSSRRTALLRSFLAANNVPRPQGVDAAGLPLNALLGLQDAVQAGGGSAGMGTGDAAAAVDFGGKGTKATKQSSAVAAAGKTRAEAEGGETGTDKPRVGQVVQGGYQSAMTERWWGDRDSRTGLLGGRLSKRLSRDGNGTATGNGTDTEQMGYLSDPYMTPDVPSPAISLSEIDKEVGLAVTQRLTLGIGSPAT